MIANGNAFVFLVEILNKLNYKYKAWKVYNNILRIHRYVWVSINKYFRYEQRKLNVLIEFKNIKIVIYCFK